MGNNSIKSRTAKGPRTSELSKQVPLGRTGDTVARNSIIKGGQRYLDREENGGFKAGSTNGVSTARGPRAPIQSPKKPSQPSRAKPKK